MLPSAVQTTEPQRLEANYEIEIRVWFQTCGERRWAGVAKPERRSGERLPRLHQALYARADVESGTSALPKFECNEAGLLWHAGLYDSGSYLLISIVPDLPFLTSHGIRTVKDVLRLRTLSLGELISSKEMEQLPLPSGFCSSLQELAEQLDKALRELWW
jgi:hypothetical protein